ncbi:MAG TPA: zinc ABC transporter ATP-binding protein AztA [Acidimicrobiia bacterium]|nr:zinc ABC transporter ATP-binding protein AztA [Acidimicrobiia bacterium]
MRGATVRAENLMVRFGQITAIDTSTFEVRSGGVTAVIGPNGSGKSTLLNAIAGLVEPTTGTLEVGVSPGRLSYVMQATKVNENLPVTVREVVTMGRYASLGAYRWMGADDRAAVDRAMERLQITGLAGRHLHDLSGGQRQRVFVAQGLAQDHDLLLLDEPLTGIDLTTAQSIDEVIHSETREGCTVVMTTHDLSEARSADYVILLSGRVVAWGAPAEVLSERHLVEAYGPSLLHVEEGRVFLDDPAHSPTQRRHSHERSIHAESDRTDLHGE